MRVTIRKALGAGVGALAVSLGTACLDGALSATEAITAAGGALVVFGTVWKLAYQVRGSDVPPAGPSPDAGGRHVA